MVWGQQRQACFHQRVASGFPSDALSQVVAPFIWDLGCKQHRAAKTEFFYSVLTGLRESLKLQLTCYENTTDQMIARKEVSQTCFIATVLITGRLRERLLFMPSSLASRV